MSYPAESLRTCLSCIDLTSLNATDTDAKIMAMAQKANEFPQQFPDMPQIAALCVYPSFTSVLRKTLTVRGVRIAVTGGGFPAAQTFLSVKIQECSMAVEEGADEVDIVLSLNSFLSEDYARTGDDISAIKEAIGHAHLKVILESGALASPPLIAHASRIAMEAGADFIKTSTGKSEPAATPQAAAVMCREILKYYQKTGKKIGFKPAGGIQTPDEALLYYSIVSEILGSEWLHPSLFRIGASRLANNLLSALHHQTVAYF
ncbi:MAG: deoxyribose-phosphate aldolase [Bacteroidetes bacterium]|nr:deoxyribose-phosphate aldolase [Bacteroidota bacterium]